jgi:hypothetical protein
MGHIYDTLKKKWRDTKLSTENRLSKLGYKLGHYL